jgi:hypothetical protein
MYLPSKFLELFGAQPYDLGQIRMDAFGFESTYFNGLPTLLLYDLGFLGLFLFSIVFFFSFIIIVGVRKKYDLFSYSVMVFYVLVPLFFFQGPIFVFASYNLSIIYLFFIVALSRIKL